MPPVTEAPARENLARLLKAKDEAKKAMSAAYLACAKAEGDALDARLALDLDRKRALQAFCAADDAYDAALAAFLAERAAA